MACDKFNYLKTYISRINCNNRAANLAFLIKVVSKVLDDKSLRISFRKRVTIKTP